MQEKYVIESERYRLQMGNEVGDSTIRVKWENPIDTYIIKYVMLGTTDDSVAAGYGGMEASGEIGTLKDIAKKARIPDAPNFLKDYSDEQLNKLTLVAIDTPDISVFLLEDELIELRDLAKRIDKQVPKYRGLKRETFCP